MALPWPSWDDSQLENFCSANHDVNSTPWTAEESEGSSKFLFVLANFFYCECPIFVMFGPDLFLGFIYN